jgi:hypothetical protein
MGEALGGGDVAMPAAKFYRQATPPPRQSGAMEQVSIRIQEKNDD